MSKTQYCAMFSRARGLFPSYRIQLAGRFNASQFAQRRLRYQESLCALIPQN